MPAFRKNPIPYAPLLGMLAMIGAAAVHAGPIQVLLDEDFQDVTGVNSASAVRTVQDILTNDPGQLPAGTSYSFSNTGSGNASASSFNVRRADNAIDGTSGTPTLGNTNFDNFFGASPNRFLVMGDNSGDLSGAPNGGTGASSSSMAIRFGLSPITLPYPSVLHVLFDYVFDANNTSNLDDFYAELILADSSIFTLLTHTQPLATTRGTFSASIP